MAQDKVTRQELREMHIGQTRIFNLPDGGKVKSAISTCQQMKNEKRMVYSYKPDWESAAISITRIK
jgi:hypothetical protein